MQKMNLATFLFATTVFVAMPPGSLAAPIVSTIATASFPKDTLQSNANEAISAGAQRSMIEGTRAVNAKDLAAARKAYNEAARLDPKSAAPFLALGELELVHQDTVAAQKALDEAVKRAPHWSVDHFQAKVQVAKNDLAGAEISLKSAVAKSPQVAQLHVVLGDFYLNRLQSLPAAKAAYAQAIAISPALASAHYALGLTMERLGETAAARKSLEQAQSLAPDVVLPTWALARMSLRENKPDDAIVALNGVLKRNPLFLTAHIDLGDAFLAKRDVAKAIASYEKFSKTQPKDATAVQKIALAHHASGNIKEASAAYRKVLTINKDAPLSLNNLAFLLAQSKTDLSEAERHAKRAIELEPKAGEALATLGWVYRAQGKLAEAEAQLHKAIALTAAESADQNAMLASILAERGSLSDARMLAQRAIAIDSKNTIAIDLLKKLKS